MVWQVFHCLPAWRSVAGRGGQGDNVTKEAAARAVEALAKVGRHGPRRRWPKWGGTGRGGAGQSGRWRSGKATMVMNKAEEAEAR